MAEEEEPEDSMPALLAFRAMAEEARRALSSLPITLRGSAHHDNRSRSSLEKTSIENQPCS